MFLSTYDFDGDPAELLPAYDRFMAASYPPGALLLHVCVVRDDGITVLDACPSRQVFEDFAASAEFADAVTRAGLPHPRVTPRGEVHSACLREAVHS